MTSYLFRLWTGPAFVRDVAAECAERGLLVPFLGAEHVYVLHESDDPDYSESHIGYLLSPLPGMVPNLWATLTPEDAVALRAAEKEF